MLLLTFDYYLKPSTISLYFDTCNYIFKIYLYLINHRYFNFLLKINFAELDVSNLLFENKLVLLEDFHSYVSKFSIEIRLQKLVLPMIIWSKILKLNGNIYKL